MATGASTIMTVDTIVFAILCGGSIGVMGHVWVVTYVEITHVLINVLRANSHGHKTFTITSTITITVNFMITVTVTGIYPLRGGAGIIFLSSARLPRARGARPFDSA